MNQNNNFVLQWTKNWAIQNQIPCQFLNQTNSTNDTALFLKNDLQKPFFIFCNKQSQSRGRKKRKWINSDFMATWTWKQKLSPHPILSLYLAWFCYKNTCHIWPGLPWSLKAPNDLYLNEKKISGILLEILQNSIFQIIIGIGMNVLKTPSLKWASINQYAEVNENQWQKFLNLFWNDLLSIQNKSISSLSSQMTIDLKKALEKNKFHKNLIQIAPNGNLIFKDHFISWSSL